MPNRIEEAASKGMGKMKSVKATFKGLSGVFKTLAEQHEEVSALMKRAKASSDPDKRADLWGKIRLELISHERGELREVYPVLRESEETRDIAQHHDKEAKELETLIGQVEEADPHTKEWASKFDKLVEMVEHHASEERTTSSRRPRRSSGRSVPRRSSLSSMAAKRAVMEQLFLASLCRRRPIPRDARTVPALPPPYGRAPRAAGRPRGCRACRRKVLDSLPVARVCGLLGEGWVGPEAAGLGGGVLLEPVSRACGGLCPRTTTTTATHLSGASSISSPPRSTRAKRRRA